MKKVLFSLIAILSASLLFAQPMHTLKTGGNASHMPAGSTVLAGKIMVSTGYKAVIAPKDNNVVMIEKTNTGTVTGSFTCECKSEGGCKASIGPTGVFCDAGKGCTECNMYVTINPPPGKAIARNSPNITWLKVSLNPPPSHTTRQ